MKKKLLCILFCFLLFSCVLTEPSMLEIDNNSSYDILVVIPDLVEDFCIKKGKSELIVCYPKKIKMTITIDSLGFEKDYSIDLQYLEKRKFEFNLK